MNKKLMITTFVWVVLGIFAVTTPVFAQEITPQDPPYGPGWMMNGYQGNYATLHDSMVERFAEKVGLSVEEVNESLLSGSTMYQIAEQQGLSIEDFYAWMNEIHNEYYGQAWEEGIITQGQTGWMNQGYQTMQEYGYGACRGVNANSAAFGVPVYRGGGYMMR